MQNDSSHTSCHSFCYKLHFLDIPINTLHLKLICEIPSIIQTILRIKITLKALHRSPFAPPRRSINPQRSFLPLAFCVPTYWACCCLFCCSCVVFFFIPGPWLGTIVSVNWLNSSRSRCRNWIPMWQLFAFRGLCFPHSLRSIQDSFWPTDWVNDRRQDLLLVLCTIYHLRFTIYDLHDRGRSLVTLQLPPQKVRKAKYKSRRSHSFLATCRTLDLAKQKLDFWRLSSLYYPNTDTYPGTTHKLG